MLLFPIIGKLLNLEPETFGFWSGASIHETAQVIGAAFQGGQHSGEVGTVAKLSRVLFLIPVMIILGYSTRNNQQKDDTDAKTSFPIPWFILGFIIMVTINSLIPLADDIQQQIKIGNKFILTVTLAAMGLHMSFSKIKTIGIRPICLGLLSWIYVSTVGLLLTSLLN